MERTKLNITIVDDSPADAGIVKSILSYSNLVNTINVFTDPKEFLDKAPGIDMDLCLLDLIMPEMDGLILAQMLSNMPVIFLTCCEKNLRPALELDPISIVFKPIIKAKLDYAIEKAHNLLSNTREYAMFNVAESRKKASIYLPDIMLVTTDNTDPRHKKIYLRNGLSYTLMNCSMEQLLAIVPGLIQVNRAELVSMDAIKEAEYDLITLKGVQDEDGRPKEVTISNSFRENFHKKFFYIIK